MSNAAAARSSPNAVSQLIKLLAEERQEPTSIEIAETLWLAMQMKPVAEVVREAPMPARSTSSNLPVEDLETRPEPEEPCLPAVASRPMANLAAPTPQAGVLPPQTLPIWLADPAMLTDSLAVIRALKPLLRKVAAGTGQTLDEAATVDNIARTRLCLPILEPAQEPWFDVVLVIDRGSSMHIWQRLVKDIVRILRRYGAFRDVQIFDLQVNSADGNGDSVWLVSNPQRPGHRPSELIDQRGRRIVILLSDCAGTYWWDGTLLPMLQDWSNAMPMVVWQMLPAWMWQRTALGRGTRVAISNDLPGGANQRLKIQVQERDEPEDIDQRIPVPVVTSEVQDLAGWSLMLAGDRREVVPGFLLPRQGGLVPRSKGIEDIAQELALQTVEASEDGDRNDEVFNQVFDQALDSIASERVQRFVELASPEAQRLIMLLAAAPVITLPVARLIRDAMLYDIQSPLPVAEVFLSGLLQRLPGQDDSKLQQVVEAEQERIELAQLEQSDQVESLADQSEAELVDQLSQQDLVQYDFLSKVRQLLLQILPAVDTVEVINSVSAAVERRWNQVTSEDFRAFLLNPNVEVAEELKGLRSFASVTADILEPLGGRYARFAQELRQGLQEPPPGDLLGEHNFPPLETFEFIDAQLVEETSTEFPPPLQTEEFTIVTLEESQQNLELFEFTVARIVKPGRSGLNTFGILPFRMWSSSNKWEIRRQQQQAYRFIEYLSEGILLEMVSIPAGTFLMGSPEDEPERSAERESPQHEVTIQPFFMGQYPITQMQWKVVAMMPQVERELKPDPSRLKGDNRPVERVSWYEAVEFCQRLSQHTEREYRLPTEGEWEYACRAGTTTPFHFGETISPELANYDARQAYADGPTGEYREETTPAPQFQVANAFGLSDMHGNVLEWCQDHWHDSYEGAPGDGSAWIEGGHSRLRVRRGGSWLSSPRGCRSAYRRWADADDHDFFIGFRVVCFAPRILQ